MKYKDNKNKRGFTLIELIAVLVIMAIIALIVTPLVMNIVKKAKDSANKRSVDAYGKAVELAIATHLLDTGDYPTSLDNLEVEYTGNEVVCNIQTLNEDGSIYLSECSVKGTEVKDSSTEDGWYHYGKTTKPYQAYVVGDIVTYNEMSFYVVTPSDEKTNYVTLLKAEPLTVDEVNLYGEGHVNMYFSLGTLGSLGTAYNKNGYGGMAYYSSPTCGNAGADGCITSYGESEIKYVVDAWSSAMINETDLTKDSLGYKTRLLTIDEMVSYLGYDKATWNITNWRVEPEYTPSWVYSDDYNYWTMSPLPDSRIQVYSVNSFPDGNGNVYYPYSTVRPVITLKKSAI